MSLIKRFLTFSLCCVAASCKPVPKKLSSATDGKVPVATPKQTASDIQQVPWQVETTEAGTTMILKNPSPEVLQAALTFLETDAAATGMTALKLSYSLRPAAASPSPQTSGLGLAGPFAKAMTRQNSVKKAEPARPTIVNQNTTVRQGALAKIGPAIKAGAFNRRLQAGLSLVGLASALAYLESGRPRGGKKSIDDIRAGVQSLETGTFFTTVVDLREPEQVAFQPSGGAKFKDGKKYFETVSYNGGHGEVLKAWIETGSITKDSAQSRAEQANWGGGFELDSDGKRAQVKYISGSVNSKNGGDREAPPHVQKKFLQMIANVLNVETYDENGHTARPEPEGIVQPYPTACPKYGFCAELVDAYTKTQRARIDKPLKDL